MLRLCKDENVMVVAHAVAMQCKSCEGPFERAQRKAEYVRGGQETYRLETLDYTLEQITGSTRTSNQ